MSVVRNLIARAGLDLSNFEKGLKTMEKKLAKTSKQLNAVGKTMTAAFTAPVAALGALSLKTVQYADDIATTATKINMSAEELQKWQHIAKQTDVEAERLTKGFTKFREAIGDRLLGNSTEATKALDGLGLTMSELKNGTAEQNFDKLIRNLAGIKDKTLQAAYANEIFGERAATDLIPLLAGGGAAIDKFSAEFEKMGYLTNEEVAKLAEFDNEMNRVKQSVSVAGAKLGTALLPVLQTLMNMLEAVAPILQTFGKFFSSMPTPIQKVAIVLMLVLAAIGPLLLIAAKFTLALKTMIPVIKAITAAQWLWNSALLANPITWIIIGVVALIAGIVLLAKKVGGFAKLWQIVWDGIKNAFKAVVNFIIGYYNFILSGLKLMINGAILLLNGLIKQANKIPGIEIKMIPKLDSSALQIPKLASGGIAYGDAIVEVGEYKNARTNPEVIAPLDKLKGMLGDTNGSMNLSIYIGDELIAKKVVRRIQRDSKLQIG